MRSRLARASAPGVVLAAVTLLLSGIAAAPQELPDAADIIARYIETAGGREAITGHTSSHATGSLELVGQGLYGTLSIYAAAPDRNLIIISFPDVGMETRTGYDGKVGWASDPMTGERVLEGPELQQLVDEADYYADLHDPAHFESIETLEKVDFGGVEAYKVQLVYKSGRQVYEYFDVETGRMIGNEQVQESIMGSMNVVTRIGDYQQFGDIWAPTKIIQEIGPGQTLAVSLESIEFDNVDPAVFELPAAIKALIR